MNIATLSTLAAASRVSQSELARLAGVSRQAVSLWFGSGRGEVDVRSGHLKRLAEGLHIKADRLLHDLPGLDPASRRTLHAELLWDRLYPDLDQFLAALVRNEPRALARFVQIFGLYRSAAILGDVVWRDFPCFARFIHPGWRRGFEALWRWRQAKRH